MVQIITDSTACLPATYVQEHQIPVIPQIVSFGNESYYEGIEIDLPTFMQRLKTSAELPKTAAPPPELFRAEFERLAPLEETILCLHPSSEVSGTVRSASVAALDFPGADIRIIDTRTAAAPLATLVRLAVEWAESGQHSDEIETRIRALIPRGRIFFLVATLEYLAKGGRIGGAAALLGSMLQIKPILTLREGRVEPYEKARTHKHAVARLIEILGAQIPRDRDPHLSVMHADAAGEARSLAGDLGRRFGVNEIPLYDLPPAIVVHGGPGILGASFFL
jgi:DegV family protein with EDD domain